MGVVIMVGVFNRGCLLYIVVYKSFIAPSRLCELKCCKNRQL